MADLAQPLNPDARRLRLPIMARQWWVARVPKDRTLGPGVPYDQDCLVAVDADGAATDEATSALTKSEIQSNHSLVFPKGYVTGVPRTSARIVERPSTKNQFAGMDPYETCSLVVGWVFTLLVWFGLGSLIACSQLHDPSSDAVGFCPYFGDTRGPAIMFGAAYVFYLIAAFTSATFSYLRLHSAARPVDDVPEFLRALTESMPTIRFSTADYHEVRKGGAEGFRKRVYTHRAADVFRFDVWDDASSIVVPSDVKYLRVRVEKSIQFMDDFTAEECDRQQTAFAAREACDDFQSVTKELHVPGFYKDLLICRGTRGCVTPAWFVFFTILTLSMPYRHYFYARSVAVDVVLQKLVRSVPMSVRTYRTGNGLDDTYRTGSREDTARNSLGASASVHPFSPPPASGEESPKVAEDIDSKEVPQPSTQPSEPFAVAAAHSEVVPGSMASASSPPHRSATPPPSPERE